MKKLVRYSVLVILLLSYLLAGVGGYTLVVELFAKQPTTIASQKSGKTSPRTTYWTQHKHIPVSTKPEQILSQHLLTTNHSVPDISVRFCTLIISSNTQDRPTHSTSSRAPPTSVM